MLLVAARGQHHLRLLRQRLCSPNQARCARENRPRRRLVDALHLDHLRPACRRHVLLARRQEHVHARISERLHQLLVRGIVEHDQRPPKGARCGPDPGAKPSLIEGGRGRRARAVLRADPAVQPLGHTAHQHLHLGRLAGDVPLQPAAPKVAQDPRVIEHSRGEGRFADAALPLAAEQAADGDARVRGDEQRFDEPLDQGLTEYVSVT